MMSFPSGGLRAWLCFVVHAKAYLQPAYKAGGADLPMLLELLGGEFDVVRRVVYKDVYGWMV